MDTTLLTNQLLLVPHIQARSQTARPDRHLMVPFIDARAATEILEAAFGIDGWSFEVISIERIGDQDWLARGRLSAFFADRTVIREDVGSSHGDLETGAKGAVSDALKRCAVQYGVGRALYRLGAEWVSARDGYPDKAEVDALVAWWRSGLEGVERGEWRGPKATSRHSDQPPQIGQPHQGARDSFSGQPGSLVGSLNIVDDGTVWRLSFPFGAQDERDDLKRLCRARWDKETKTWTVGIEHRLSLIHI